MSKKQMYRACVPTGKFTPKGESEVKQKWTQVGAAFVNDGGSINIKLDENISVSNEMVLFPPKEDEK